MSSYLKKIVVKAIDNQWIEVEKDMVMGYTKKYFLEWVDWIYGWYVQITLWRSSEESRQDASNI